MTALRKDIGDNEPLTLAEACDVLFGGRITPATLREVYAVDAAVVDVPLPGGGSRRVCVPARRA